MPWWADITALTCSAASAVRQDPVTPARKKDGSVGLLFGEPEFRPPRLQAVKRAVFDGTPEPRAVPIKPGEAHDRSEPDVGVRQQILVAGDVQAQRRFLHPTRYMAAPGRQRFRQLDEEAFGLVRFVGRRVVHKPEGAVDGPVQVVRVGDGNIQGIPDQIHHARSPDARNPRDAARQAVCFVGLSEGRFAAEVPSFLKQPVGEQLFCQPLTKAWQIAGNFIIRQVRRIEIQRLVELFPAVGLRANQRVDECRSRSGGGTCDAVIQAQETGMLRKGLAPGDAFLTTASRCRTIVWSEQVCRHVVHLLVQQERLWTRGSCRRSLRGGRCRGRR